MSNTLSKSVAAGIDRCAAAFEDLPLLRDEVNQLRQHPEQTAEFATALFDLERVQRGDPEARQQLIEVADALLVFWRERSGDALADSHPVLGPLWARASKMLILFEIKQFKRALDVCWEAKSDAAQLQTAIAALLPAGNRRVEFAACLYHLELARLFVHTSRAEFARRASLVHEAYHSKETAEELVGDDLGLQHLWEELVPYLDEFFEALEAEQEKKLRSNMKTDPGGEAAVPRESVPPTEIPALAKKAAPTLDDVTEAPVGVTFLGPAPTRTSRSAAETTNPGMPLFEAIDLPAAPAPKDLTPTPAPIEAIEEVLAPLPNAPPPPPSNFTPAPGTLFAAEFDVADTAPRIAHRPPLPPSNFTPTPGSIPAFTVAEPDLTGRRTVGSDSGILDLQDIIDEVPIPPARPNWPSLEVELGDYEPDEAAQTFWRHTEEALTLLPSPDAPRMDRRTLSADGRAERKKLNGWLDSVGRGFDTVPEAKTFACLMKLYMAAQLKEKSLFGGVNAKRKEAFISALELLSAEPLAAGHCAVWFELDGKETLEHLGTGLEVLTDYLQFCARENLDPLDPAVPSQFMAA